VILRALSLGIAAADLYGALGARREQT